MNGAGLLLHVVGSASTRLAEKDQGATVRLMRRTRLAGAAGAVALMVLMLLVPHEGEGRSTGPATEATVVVPGRAVVPACTDGVVLDDGEPETGYGWVPSVVEGIFVQEFEVADLPSRRLESVCICWMRSRADDTLDFDVVIYPEVNGAPALEPAVVVPASVQGVPQALDGVFAEVQMPGDGVMVGSERIYVGARWNASVDQFFFICADQTESTPVVNGFFIDDRADEWESVLDTSDPIFLPHRAMLIRAVAAAEDGFGVPAAGTAGLALLALVLAGLAILRLRPGRG